MTVRPAFERSSATTLWISAHCSVCAPGGVSQRICQSPWTERTAPWALAGVVRPNQQKMAKPVAIPQTQREAADPLRGWLELVGYFEGPIRVDPLIFLRLMSSAKPVVTGLIRQ